MEKTARKRSIGQAALGTAFMALASVTMGQAVPHARLLTETAHRIMTVNAAKTSVCWLSAHRLLVVTTLRDVESVMDRNDRLRWRNWHGVVEIVDTSTHTRHRLLGLTRLLNRPTADPMFGPMNFEISPDGAWLLWETPVWGDGWPCPHAARWDGAHHREWFRFRWEEKFFVNSHTLVQLNEHDPATVRDLWNPKKDRELSKPRREQALLARYAAQYPVFVTVTGLEKKGRGSSVEIATFRTLDWLRSVRSMGENDGPGPIRAVDRTLPVGATFRDADVSPRQEAIFYDLLMSRPHPRPASSHANASPGQSKQTPAEWLWVSRADGRGMHAIGWVPVSLNTEGHPADALQDVRWLPDGKQISYIYHGILYQQQCPTAYNSMSSFRTPVER